MALEHILVAHDGSDEAQHALEVAVELATGLGARLTVMHVVRTSAAKAMIPADMQEYERLEHLHVTAHDVVIAAGNRLLDVAMGTCRSAGVDAETMVREGDPAKVITEEAADLGADLVVMGSRGLSDAKGLLLGSVSHKVMSACASPVLVTR